MKRFSDWRLGLRLGFGFGACVLLALLFGILSLGQQAALGGKVELLDTAVVHRLEALIAATKTLGQSQEIAFRIALADKADRAALLDDLRATDQSYAAAAAEIKKYLTKGEDPKLIATLNEQVATLQGQHKKLDELADRSQEQAVRYVKQTMVPSFEAAEKALADVVKQGETMSEGVARDAVSLQATGVKKTIVTLVLMSVIAIGIAFVITRSITAPVALFAGRLDELEKTDLSDLQRSLAALEKGDLTVDTAVTCQPLNLNRGDEIGDLARTFDQMLNRIGQTVESYRAAQKSVRTALKSVAQSAIDVRIAGEGIESASQATAHSAEAIMGGINQLAQAADESSRGSQEIAEGGEHLARAATTAAQGMEGLYGAIERVQTGNGEQSMATSRATEAVQTGSTAIGQAVTTMSQIQDEVAQSALAVQELGDKSQQIGAIVQTIEDIAAQTNLLALNAAIEAARAGEMGRGFAVVADEVRKLAERSSSATQEIAELIAGVQSSVDHAVSTMRATTDRVAEGATSSQAAGESLGAIEAAIREVIQVGRRLEGAVGEMSTGAKMVQEAISQVASVSQESAAAAEELSASAEEVSATAASMTQTAERQSAMTQEMSASAAQLSRLSRELEGLCSQFQLEVMPETTRRAA